MSASSAGAPSDQRHDDEDFKDYKERVFQQKKKQILDQIKELQDGNHAGYNEKVLGLKQVRDYQLRVNARRLLLETDAIRDEYGLTVARVNKESADKIDQLEKKMKTELEQYKNELHDDHKERGDPKDSIMSDLDISGKKHRTNSDKRRKRLFDETGQVKSAYNPGKRRRAKGVGADKSAPLKLNKQKQEELETWEVEMDIRVMNNLQGVSSRGRRPPAKLLAAGSR